MIREHGLSIAIATVWLLLCVASFVSFDDTTAAWLAERAGGHADDAFGALLIVVATKWLRERGSPQSK